MTKDQKEVLDEVIRLSKDLESLKQWVSNSEQRLREVEAQRERDNTYFTVQLEQLKARVRRQEELLAEGAEIVDVLTLENRNLCFGRFKNKVSVWRNKAKGGA